MPRKTVKTKTKKPVVTLLVPENFSVSGMIAAIILIALLLLGGFGISRYNQLHPQKGKSTINGTQIVSYSCEEGKTALDMLKVNAQIETADSEAGAFPITINGIPDTQDHFWMFYINGELAQSAPAQYTCKSGDKVEWRFEQFTFE